MPAVDGVATLPLDAAAMQKGYKVKGKRKGKRLRPERGSKSRENERGWGPASTE